MESVDRVRQFIASRPRQAREIISRYYNDRPTLKNELLHDWRLWRRPEQDFMVPQDKTAVLLLAGRGWGKSHWLSNEIISTSLSKPNLRILLMAADFNNLKKVNFLGDSGIINCINPDIKYEFNKTDLSLMFENGSQVISYSAEAYDKTRGSQFHYGFLDELAAWQYASEGLEAARLVMRLGEHPKLFIATTPRPTAVIRELVADPDVMVINGKTEDNYFLPPQYIDQLRKKLTDRMFRQECLAQILDDNPYALWRMSDIDASRVGKSPELRRIVVGVDPAVTSSDDSDETGIVVAGVGYDGRFYVLEDCTMTAATPEQWAARAIEAYEKWDADSIVAEVNQGGDMVESLLLRKSRGVRVQKVRATKGKEIRAEPIAALYERREASHVGRLDDLERQMTEWDPVNSKKSPDRIDALVWALTELSGIGKPAGALKHW